VRVAALFAPRADEPAWGDPLLGAMSALAALGPKPHRLSLPRFRRGYDRLGLIFGRTKARTRVESLRMSGAAGPLRARRYRPPSPPRGRLVYFHGGGFSIGSIASHDHFCRFISQASGAEIISVEYRLAPEHPFPAGVEDAIASLRAAADNQLWLSPDLPLVVGGDSAGGNLALIAAQQAEPRLIDGLWLVYPTVGGTVEMIDDSHRLPDSFGLPRETAAWFLNTYAPEPAERDHPWMQPGTALDCAGLPPTYLGLVERDLLFEGGIKFARRLDGLGVEQRTDALPDVPHAFIHMIGVSAASHAAACRLGQGLDWLFDRAGKRPG
jgi:acetyl esterase